MDKTNKNNFVKGAIFGLLAPFIGMFTGLQIAPFIGTILMFPFVAISKMISQPFGEFSTTMMVLSIVLSIVIWGFIFALFANIISKFKK
jgi:hypothetical protein